MSGPRRYLVPLPAIILLLHCKQEPQPEAPKVEKLRQRLEDPFFGAPSLSVFDDGFNTATPLVSAVDIFVISETTFQALLQAPHDGVDTDIRHAAVQVTAALSDPFTLGVWADLTEEPYIEGQLWIVLRDPADSPEGGFEGRDLFVAAVHLAGTVPWFGYAPRIVYREGFPAGQCSDVYRGCAPQNGAPGSALTLVSTRETYPGLTEDITLNLEGARGPANASNVFPVLRLYTPDDMQAPNQYLCHGPATWSACNDEPVTGDLASADWMQSLPEGTVMIGEHDFLLALNNTYETTEEDERLAAVRYGTAANLDEAVAIQGEYMGPGSFEGRLFVVVRQPITDGSYVQSKHSYIVPIVLSGEASWVATAPGIVFNHEFPPIDELLGTCGLITVPELAPPVCDRPPCIPDDFPLADHGFSFGSERWPAQGRTTVRIPLHGESRFDLMTLACTMFEPPPPPSPCGGPIVVGVSYAEVCNGLDDDCDGDIDENDVCGNRQVCMMCQAKTCAQQGIPCGMATNGCGMPFDCGVCP